ncbi:MAG: hypothetical protein ACHQ9S_27835 [Candidatus Binatia bacterium]
MQRRKDLPRNDHLLRDAIAAQSKPFAARFGREPTPYDPVFFCWHSDTPRAMCDLCFAEYERAIVAAAEEAGIDPGEALEIAGVEDPFGSLRSTH